VADGSLFSRCAGCLKGIPNTVAAEQTAQQPFTVWCATRLNSTSFSLQSKDVGLLLSVRRRNYNASTRARALDVTGTKPNAASTWAWEDHGSGVYSFKLQDNGWYLGICRACNWHGVYPNMDALVYQGKNRSNASTQFTIEQAA